MHNISIKVHFLLHLMKVKLKTDMDILVAIVMIGVIVSIIEMLYNLIKGKIVY